MNFMSRMFLFRFSINLTLALDKSGGKGTSNLVFFFRDLHLIKINQDMLKKGSRWIIPICLCFDLAEGKHKYYLVIG